MKPVCFGMCCSDTSFWQTDARHQPLW